MGDPITDAIQAAPELATAPGLVIPLSEMPGDVTGNAQAVAHAVNTTAAANAYDAQANLVGGPNALNSDLAFHGVSPGLSAADPTNSASQAAIDAQPTPRKPKSGGLLGDVMNVVGDVASGIGHVGSMALHALNAPLQQIQHEYRYLHDVESQHGPMAAILDGLGIAAGAGVGAFLGGSQGAKLGGEAAAGIEGQVAFHDSWDRTANGAAYRDPSTGQQVSFGRDIANLISKVPGVPDSVGTKGAAHGIISGLFDAGFDLSLDPIAVSAGLKGAATSAEGAGGLLGARFSGTLAKTGDDVARIYEQYPSVQRAFADLAKSDAGTIIQRYGRNYGNLAAALGEASTPEEVAGVFRDALEANQLVSTGQMPRLSLTKIPFRALIEGAQENGVTGAILRPFQRLPDAFDPEALAFSNKEFSPGDDFGARGIYQSLLYSQKPSVAREAVNAYLNTADPGERIGIYRDAIMSMIVARSKAGDDVLADPEVQRNLWSRITDLTGGSAPGKTAYYGVDTEGHDLSKIPTADGTGSISTAITDNQVGKLAFPNYTAVKRVAAELDGGKHLFGSLDDYAYEHFTQGFFKKLVLLSGSFAAHIVAAEDIPNSLRLGVRNMAQGAVENAGAKLGLKATEDELGPISGAIYKLLGSPTVVPGEDDMNLAAKLVLANDGHITPAGVTADHALGADTGVPQEAATRNLRNASLQTPPKMKQGDEFGLFGTGDSNQAYHWGGWLREIAGDEKSQLGAQAYKAAIASGADEPTATAAGAKAISDWLDAQPESHLNNYARHFQSSTPDISPHEDWGRVAMENIKGATTGADGTVHVPLLDAIANGDPPTVHSLGDIDPVSRPTMVKGRQFMPDTNGSIDRIANWGHQKVLGPIINYLSREPIYYAEVKAQYEPLQALVEAGTLTDAEALQMAQTRAVTKMSGFVHNVQERTQLSETMRNFAPFYFAQEQSYKRFGRLLAEDPAAFRKFQLADTMFADVSHQQTGKNGQSWAVYPGTGFITQGVMSALGAMGVPTTAALPLAFSGSTSSLAPVFPFSDGVRPGVGPLVSIPAHLLENLDPHLAPAVAAVIGDKSANGPIWEQVVPNVAVQRIMQGFAGDNSRSFQSAMMQQIQSLEYQQNTAMDKWNKKYGAQSLANAPGLLVPGNIDITARPVVHNADGSVSTVDSISIEDNGKEVLIPTVRAGLDRLMSTDEAIAYYRQTGQHLGIFDNANSADQYAVRLHDQQAAMLAHPKPSFIPDPNDPDPTARQRFIDRVKNQTRILFILKAVMGEVTPASPQFAIGDLKLPQDYQNLVNTKGISAGTQQFLLDHPDATPYTVFQSDTPSKASLSASENAQQWINDNIDFVHKYPTFSAFMVPQETNPKYSPAVYNEQLAMGLREKKTPLQFLNDFYIASGNQDYFGKDKPAHDQIIAQLKANGDTAGIHAEDANWNAYLDTKKISNPIWYDWFKSADRQTQATNTLDQLQKAFAAGDVPAGQQATDIGGLLHDYQQYQNSVIPGRNDLVATASKKAAKANFDAYLAKLATDKPNLAPLINKVFRSVA